MLQNTKKAFSLAEAVITLVFLSLLASQLIPAVNTSRPSNEKVLFKKAYSTIENTIAKIIGNENLYPISYIDLTCNGLTQSCMKGFLDTGTGSASSFETRSIYYNYHSIVDDSKCTSGSKLVRLFCASLNTTTATCQDKSGSQASTCRFTTTDGMEWTITENPTVAEYTPQCCHTLMNTKPMLTIMVDVNGPAEPNTNTGVNIPDQYHLNVYYNGKVEVNKTASPKGITFLKNPTNNKRRSDLEDDRFGKD